MDDPRRHHYVHNIPAARQLRRRLTATEALLWDQLRNRRLRGLKFRRQHAIRAYVVDFYCEGLSLAIEVDGGIHDDPEQHSRDAARQSALEALGVRFLRVRADEVESNITAVLTQIAEFSPSPATSGEGAGGG